MAGYLTPAMIDFHPEYFLHRFASLNTNMTPFLLLTENLKTNAAEVRCPRFAGVLLGNFAALWSKLTK